MVLVAEKGVAFLFDEVTFMCTINNISGDIIIEYPLEKSMQMSRINPSSVNAIRMMTLPEKEENHCVSKLLRVGVGGACVGNQSSGVIVCGINENDSLKSERFDKN